MIPDDLPPVLEQEEVVPFETVPGRPPRLPKSGQRVQRKREKPASALAIAVLTAIYFGGSLAVYSFDHGFLLSAWLLTGPWFAAVCLAPEARGRLLSPYSLFLATALVACLAGYLAEG